MTEPVPPSPDWGPVQPTAPDWVSQRPFWGGLLLFLSGFELFLSSNLNLGALQVHFGPSGFLSYLLPAMLLLCGVLAVLSAGQRLFYGIVGLLTALFSLIGLNLGGFFVGAVLGVLGGALTVAWAPIQKAPAVEPEEPTVDDYYAMPTVEHDSPAPQSFEAPSAYADDHAYSAYSASGDDTVVTPAPIPAPRREGLLTDSLPIATRSPLHAAVEEESGSGAGRAEDPDVDGTLPRRRGPYLGGFLVLVLLGAVAYGAAVRPASAFAAPPPLCATPTNAASPGGGPSGTPGKTTAAAPSAPAAPSPDPSPSGGGNVLQDILHGIVGLVTGGGDQPTPTPTPTPAPPSPPGPTKKTVKIPTCTPKATASPTPTVPKKAALAPGQPYVADPPSTMIVKTLTMSGLSYDGVVDLPTRSGTIAALKFSMSKSVSTPFELDTPAEHRTLYTKATSLTVEGNVSFYTSSFFGNVLGVIPMTFTPSQPPPLILPELFFTDCNIKLVFVQSDILTAPGLSLGY